MKMRCTGILRRMKVLFITGIFDAFERDGNMWGVLRREFASSLPGSESVVAHRFFAPWQGKKMRSFGEDTLKEHDTGEDLILVGHSLGGLLACAIAPRFTRSKIVCVVTLSTPHRIGFFRRMLGVPPALAVPVLSFGSLFDVFVPAVLTRHEKAILHQNLFSGHIVGLFGNPGPARRIARSVATFLTSIST